MSARTATALLLWTVAGGCGSDVESGIAMDLAVPGSTDFSAPSAPTDLATRDTAQFPPDLATTDFGSPDLSSIDLATVDLATVDLATVDVATVDLSTSDLASIDLASIDFNSKDLSPAASPDLISTVDAGACGGACTSVPYDGGAGGKACDPFADRVISFSPGANAGFGQNAFPQIVLGPPQGAGANLGSLDVLSLGLQGTIILAFDDIGVVDGPGPDLLVFENPTVNFKETGYVAVSEDGITWHEWPCAPLDAAHNDPGCAGVNPVYSNSMNGIDPTDPTRAGGDAFDLATIGVVRARYVRIRDSGHNTYTGIAGGFDLDAIAVVHGSPIACW